MVDAATKATNTLISQALGPRQQAAISSCVPRPDECCVPDALAWMNNAVGDNPCEVVRSLMERCTPAFQLNVLAHDLACPLTAASGLPNPCCCSTVTFTLFAACHMCQSHSGSVTTYYSFLNRCGADIDWGRLPHELATNQTASLDIPEWAFIVPSQYNVPWNSTAALQNATETLAQTKPTSSSATPPSGISPATIAAIISTLGLALLLVLFFYLCRIRRRRHQRKGSTAPLLPGTSGSDPTTIRTFGNWQPTNQNASRITMVRGAVDLIDELSETSLRDPGAPRNPWDKGRKLNVPKYDVERDEYGQIKAVYQTGIAGPPVALAEPEFNVEAPPAVPPKSTGTLQPPLLETQERRIDLDAGRLPIRRLPSRKPGPMVTPSIEGDVTRQHLPSAIEPQTPYFVIGRDVIFDDDTLPSARPKRRPSRARRDMSLPPPPRNEPPIIVEPTPPTPAQSGMREKVRGPLMVRNSNLSSLSGSSSNGSPPMAPSTMFLASVNQPYPLLSRVVLSSGHLAHPAPDGFALGQPPPPSWHRPMPVPLTVVTGSASPSTAIDSAKGRQLPPIPAMSPLLTPRASTSKQRL